RHTDAVGEWPFIGSEAIAAGRMTAYALRSRFVAIHPDVYNPKGAEVTAVSAAKAAWLWSRRRGPISCGATWREVGRPSRCGTVDLRQSASSSRYPPVG